ncbi:hypothetical protein Agub_g4755, partial [Astrephomene gubernaculifera]
AKPSRSAHEGAADASAGCPSGDSSKTGNANACSQQTTKPTNISNPTFQVFTTTQTSTTQPTSPSTGGSPTASSTLPSSSPPPPSQSTSPPPRNTDDSPGTPGTPGSSAGASSGAVAGADTGDASPGGGATPQSHVSVRLTAAGRRSNKQQDTQRGEMQEQEQGEVGGQKKQEQGGKQEQPRYNPKQLRGRSSRAEGNGGADSDSGGNDPRDHNGQQGPPGRSLYLENALIDSYSWHGIKRLYRFGIFFLLVFMALWWQTENGAAAFKSS